MSGDGGLIVERRDRHGVDMRRQARRRRSCRSIPSGAGVERLAIKTPNRRIKSPDRLPIRVIVSCNDRRAIPRSDTAYARDPDRSTHSATRSAVNAFGAKQRVAVKAKPPRDRPTDVGPQRRALNTNDGIGKIWQRDAAQSRPKQGWRRTMRRTGCCRRRGVRNESPISTAAPLPKPPARKKSRRALSGDAMRADALPARRHRRDRSSSQLKTILADARLRSPCAEAATPAAGRRLSGESRGGRSAACRASGAPSDRRVARIRRAHEQCSAAVPAGGTAIGTATRMSERRSIDRASCARSRGGRPSPRW